ncbi:MAG: DotH/IcmK family type IV secretion protein [Coxiellaceae bacterium]|nr:DotH/IcmK family type IV secretion protein [Coxiellaceae bacterium]
MKKEFYLALLMIATGALFVSGIAIAQDASLGLPNPTTTLAPPSATPLPSPATVPGTTLPQTPSLTGVAPVTALPASAPIPAAPAVSNDAFNTAPSAPTSLYTGSQDNPGDSSPASTTLPASGPADGSAIAAQQAAQKARIDSPDAFGNTTTSRTAFTQMLRNIMPLTPTQIITLRGLFDKTQQAVSTYPGTPPKPTSSSIFVNMSPGATPPVIRLRNGYVTSMVFLDSTGQPWPVVGYDLGNPKAFNMQPSAPDGKSNTLLIQAMDRYQQGNLAVMLKGENTPVMLTLMPGQRAVDYRVDLRIPGLGPNAMVVSNSLPQAENPVLLSFLDGTPPQNATLLHVEGASAQAWVYDGFLYLRARFTILSPGWIATMSSPDGTHVYELAKTPIILASQRGEMVRLSIKGL